MELFRTTGVQAITRPTVRIGRPRLLPVWGYVERRTTRKTTSRSHGISSTDSKNARKEIAAAPIGGGFYFKKEGE